MSTPPQGEPLATAAGKPRTLPPLRQDLEIRPGTPAPSGAPAWVIYDPLQHRYFHVGREAHTLVALWRAGMTASELADKASTELALTVAADDVERFAGFIERSNLAVLDRPDAWREFAARASQAQPGLLHRILHGYLFFKVPVLRPQRFLEALQPYAAPLYTRRAAYAVAAAGTTGLYLVSRQWEAFLGTFQTYWSWDGALCFALTLLLTKALHEMGHAVTAVRYGCHVPTMGVAFMVLAPLLYTDVSDAWRLKSRRQRLFIHGAGIIVELALACLATLLWAFLPDGMLRSAAFSVAAASWIVTLLVNLNPLMRFDGYYLFADFLGIQNLQSRSTALGQWKLRQLLFAPAIEPPEILDRRWRNGLIAYAWASWLYRLIVFTGIALLVYHYFFKLMGIVLFGVEIWYFIARPIAHELKAWTNIAPQSASPRRLALTAGTFSLLILAVALPLPGHVAVPAVIEVDGAVHIYPPRPAEVVAVNVKRGDRIAAGTVMAELAVPEIDADIRTARIKIDLTEMRLARTTDDRQDRNETLVLTHEYASLQTRLAGLEREKAELSVRAPVSGTVLELPAELHAGRWLAKSDLVAVLGDAGTRVVRGYVPGTSLYRIEDGAAGTFVPDDVSQPGVPVRLTGIARAGTAAIDIPELASPNGGPIAAEHDERQALVPTSAQYRVDLAPAPATQALTQMVRGMVTLDATPESLLVRAWRQITRVLVRESGF